MSSRASFSDDSRMIRKPMPKSLLLRDYLRDDMSSCSSNGFRSYPRRQCCTTVRFLVEKDLNRNSKRHLDQHRRSILESKSKWKSKSKSKPKPKQLSVLQRASAVMINAFKQFQFSGSGNPKKSNILPRSLSRKLSKHGFWKKTDHHNTEITVKRLKSFGDFIKEKQATTPPQSPSRSKFATAITTTTTTSAELTSSTSNSTSWSDSDFTTTTGNSSEVNLGQTEVKDASPENKKTTNRNIVGATTATATGTTTNYSPTTDNAKKKWQNEQDEQLSPVSVMDFPCNNDNDIDDEDEGSSEFQYRHLHVEGIEKPMFKTRRFKGVPQLEPIKLEDRIAQMDFQSPTQTSYEQDQKENQDEKKAIALLQLMKSTVSSHGLFKYEATECLLLEYFKERMIEQNVSDYKMLQEAKDWMDGQLQEMVLDWESKNNRETYLRETEKGVKWSKYDDEVDKENVGLELEYEIFTSLVDDILLDFHL